MVEDGGGNRVASIVSFYDDEVEDGDNSGAGDGNNRIESYYV